MLIMVMLVIVIKFIMTTVYDDEDGDDNEDDINNRNRSYLLSCQTKVYLIPLDTIGGSVVNKHQSNTMKKSRGEAVTVRH